MNPPTDAELNELAALVDSQLKDLLALTPEVFQVFEAGEMRGRSKVNDSRNLRSTSLYPKQLHGDKNLREKLPVAPQQQAVIEQATGEAFESFWAKYLRHAKRDLCLPGGLLYEQWHKWRDLESKTAVRVSYGCLAGMGISSASIGPVAVAAAVIMLNIALKIGIDALCEDCTGATP